MIRSNVVLGLALLALPLVAEQGKLPFAKEIQLQRDVYLATGLLQGVDEAYAEPFAKLDEQVAEKKINAADATALKTLLKSSLDRTYNARIFGPEDLIADLVKGPNDKDAERRFLLVVPEGAYTGLFPGKPSLTNPSKQQFYVVIPNETKDEYYFEYSVDPKNDKTFFSKVVSGNKEDYKRVEVESVAPAKVRKRVVEDLTGTFLIARAAYGATRDVTGVKLKKISTAEYKKILKLASEIEPVHEEFTQAVKGAIEELK